MNEEPESKNFQALRCARDWIRTSTSLRMLPPEDSASTNFATRAISFLQRFLKGCQK